MSFKKDYDSFKRWSKDNFEIDVEPILDSIKEREKKNSPKEDKIESLYFNDSSRLQYQIKVGKGAFVLFNEIFFVSDIIQKLQKQMIALPLIEDFSLNSFIKDNFESLYTLLGELKEDFTFLKECELKLYNTFVLHQITKDGLLFLDGFKKEQIKKWNIPDWEKSLNSLVEKKILSKRAGKYSLIKYEYFTKMKSKEELESILFNAKEFNKCLTIKNRNIQEIDKWFYHFTKEKNIYTIYKEIYIFYCRLLKKEPNQEELRNMVKCIYFQENEYQEFQLLSKVILSIPGDVTIVVEDKYVDKYYRDVYYNYYSSQHFDIQRFSYRLSFFEGLFCSEEKGNVKNFFAQRTEENNIDEINRHFYGTMVIRPFINSQKRIGTTLLSPKLFCEEKAWLRTSTFKVHILGFPFKIKAFPYRTQDSVTMTCSEISILNLMQYFSNQFKEYHEVLPTDILEVKRKYNEDRAVPSSGMTYHVFSKILMEFGLDPILYNQDVNAIEKENSLNLSNILYYYIESGIPVAINLEDDTYQGHSIICIGHGERNIDTEKFEYLEEDKEDSIRIYDTADFYNDFVIIDDNQLPYAVRDFDYFSMDSSKVKNLCVPLYKRMNLDAKVAKDLFMSIIKRYQKTGKLDKNKELVIRMFLTSSHGFKKKRTKFMFEEGKKNKKVYQLLGMAYSCLNMPSFVWVCEIYNSLKDYENGNNAIGEIVLDATAVPSKNRNGELQIPNLIIFNFPNDVYMRGLEDEISNDFYQMTDPRLLKKGIQMYKKNLLDVLSLENNYRK